MLCVDTLKTAGYSDVWLLGSRYLWMWLDECVGENGMCVIWLNLHFNKTIFQLATVSDHTCCSLFKESVLKYLWWHDMHLKMKRSKLHLSMALFYQHYLLCDKLLLSSLTLPPSIRQMRGGVHIYRSDNCWSLYFVSEHQHVPQVYSASKKQTWNCWYKNIKLMSVKKIYNRTCCVTN